ncbi:hypothetical protein EDB86DRAFT_1184782 [Lactarius hatsudake]|nr:hypothetical protein EDB86DRAFT_1184782 [Lactarius hatsudake]
MRKQDVDPEICSPWLWPTSPLFRRIGRRPRPAHATQGGDAGPASALLAGGAGGAASPNGGLAAAEHFSGMQGGGPGGAARGGVDGGREPGGGKAGVGAGAPREGTRNDVSDDIKRRHRRDYVFNHVLCHSIHMRGGGRRPLASYEPVTFPAIEYVRRQFYARRTHITW